MPCIRRTPHRVKVKAPLHPPKEKQAKIFCRTKRIWTHHCRHTLPLSAALAIFPASFYKVKLTMYMSGTWLVLSKSWVEKFGKECHRTMYGISRLAQTLNESVLSLSQNSGIHNPPSTCTARATRWELQISHIKSFIFYILYSWLLTRIVNHSTWDIRKWRQRKLPPYLQEIVYIDFYSILNSQAQASLRVIRREVKCIPIL